MPIEVGIWRVDHSLKNIAFKEIDLESELQQIIADDISVVDSRLMVIGREVISEYGGRMDVLAIDGDGNLAVIELKRNQTPREVVAQVLDYGSWIRHLTMDDIAEQYINYQVRFLNESTPRSINDALKKRFGSVPDTLNSSHRLIIVAGSLDPSTERIVTYLMDQYGVEINAVFVRMFEDDDRKYLTRAWLKEPVVLPAETLSRPGTGGEWNGEFYVSFGVGLHRRWPDAKKYGFISAGGGEWYVNTLRTLQPGNRIWVNVPGTGYVGVGEVVSAAVRFDQFKLSNQGVETPIADVEVEAPEMFDQEHSEHIVGVNWTKAVDLHEAVKEIGFFGNQNTVAKPRAQSWHFTVERLKTLWRVS